MARRRRGLNIMGMPDASSITRRAIVEVAAAHAASPKDPVLRRYRLARVPLYTGPAPVLDRFAHLRASHD
jgi:hypothetical protein